MYYKKIARMILYFSGTGNTRWIATKISEAIGEKLCYIPNLFPNTWMATAKNRA